ncbi:E3 ubiquitin ligase [Wolffia australiana]
MSSSVRELSVLGEFKPHGLVVEAPEWKPELEEDPETEGTFNYYLFDPDVIAERNAHPFGNDDFPTSSSVFNQSDHEIFIRGNSVVWSVGSRIEKRYTSPSSVVMACWCRMDSIPDALLCVLQIDNLSIYTSTGELSYIPLSYAVRSIWSVPHGLLIQKESVGGLPSNQKLSFLKKELSDQISPDFHSPFDQITGDATLTSSHLILKHPFQEPQSTYVEERGKLTIMKDFDERILWTSDIIPLFSSYNEGNMKHSIWLLEVGNPGSETVAFSHTVEEVLDTPYSQLFSFRRIWQGTCSHCAAKKVFWATDIDGVPIICFLLQEQKMLLAVRLLIDEMMGDFPVEFRPHTSWTIHAIAAVPVVVSRSRVQICQLPHYDIIVLTSDNKLLLYSGKQCLCRYVFPVGLELHKSLPSQSNVITKDLKIMGVADPVRCRVNVIINGGQMLRCSLSRSSSSSLVDDCITALAEGVHSSFYNHFIVSLWTARDSDSEWESLKNVLMRICEKHGSSFPDVPREIGDTSWDFLISSTFHKNYHQLSSFIGVPYSPIHNVGVSVYSAGRTRTDGDHDSSFYMQFLVEVLDSLHTLYECLKLDNLRKQDLILLVEILHNIAGSLCETSYVDYYVRDFPFITPEIVATTFSSSPRNPPSLFRWLEMCLLYGFTSFEQRSDLPLMVCKDKRSVISLGRKIVAFFSILVGAKCNEKKLSSGVYCDIAPGTASTPEELTVLAMVGECFGLMNMDLLPAGVSLPLRHALDKCRESPPTDWPAAAYVLVGREDLAMGCLHFSGNCNELKSQTCSNQTSVCTPYTLPLRPVVVPSSVSDLMQSDSSNIEEVGSVEDSFEDGMEHIVNSSTKLRYGRDLRLYEVRRLMCSARAVAIQTPANPSASDQEMQQHQLWNLAQRTSALPFGRGAFTLATTHTLLTEALPVPQLVFSGRLPAHQNATVNFDPNVRNISELGSWPEFHNGVAAGLRLAPFQGKMSRTWIQYNKPEEPSVIHAGVLLALGLHGHLRVLTISDVYRYLSLEHDHTTVGILLGMAASHRGSMHPGISKMLYLHIPSRHPSSFPELELPTILQSAALLAVGLLYEGSAHPLNMKILLGEIGRRSGGDNVLEREGYSVAAGSALGLVALGRGKDAPGFMESVVDRLFQYIGCRRDDNVVDGSQINFDVTSPGATIALALIFLKTECETTAMRLSIPVTHFDLQYVRPDFVMLRVMAHSSIMWNSIQPSVDWVESQVPEIVKVGMTNLSDEITERGYDGEALAQAYVNVISGACISLGLKFAGSRNGDAQELLYGYAVYFLNEIKPISGKMVNSFPKGLSEFLSRGTLENCLHLIVLSLSVVMAGSGHLQTLKLLRFLRSRGSADNHINYGFQMAVSLSIGFLFLGGGMQTFCTSNSAIAALLISMYPRLPSGPNDNRCHLQAFRHLYAIAAESRWVQTVDVDTGLPVYAPLEMTVVETQNFAETCLYEVTPCLLPERSLLKRVRVCGPRYWPQVIHLHPEDKPWWRPGEGNNPFNGGVLYIKRKVGVCSYVDDPSGCQSLLSRAVHKGLAVRDGDKSSEVKVDQLVSTFSADPSLIAFAQLCCNSSWNARSNADFAEFCSQVLLECVSKDRAALLQVYLSFYINIGSMWEQAKSGHLHFQDSIFLSSLKIAIAYNEAIIQGRLTSPLAPIMQPTFIDSLRWRVEEMLNSSDEIRVDLGAYLQSGWRHKRGDKSSAILLAWYLKWFGVPSLHEVKSALVKVNPKVNTSSAVPLLSMISLGTHVGALYRIVDAAATSDGEKMAGLV